MNNRKATQGRTIVSKPVLEDVTTKFGMVKQKTNRFVHTFGYHIPKIDHKMSEREKAIRKELKKRKYGKPVTMHEDSADLRKELNLIVVGLTPVPTNTIA